MYQTNEYIDFPHHGLVSDFCPEQHAHPDPQAVEIAIGVNRNSFIISQAEGDIGFVIGFQSLALSTVFGLDIDPLDEVFRKHRMDFLRVAA